jgi:hypothetical protein
VKGVRGVYLAYLLLIVVGVVYCTTLGLLGR